MQIKKALLIAVGSMSLLMGRFADAAPQQAQSQPIETCCVCVQDRTGTCIQDEKTGNMACAIDYESPPLFSTCLTYSFSDLCRKEVDRYEDDCKDKQVGDACTFRTSLMQYDSHCVEEGNNDKGCDERKRKANRK